MMLGYILLFVILVFLGVVLVRGAAFKPKDVYVSDADDIEVDVEGATAHLRELVRCKTVSYTDLSKVDEAEFEKLRGLLKEFYPTVFSTCELTMADRTGMLLHWKGKSSDAPSVLMAHYDVVPAEGNSWQKPPFEGVIEDGVLWGRGTTDTKITLCASLEAAESLMKRGFVPENDIYFSFAGDEEVSGTGAPAVVDLLEQRGVRPQLVVDEGGAVVENVFPGVKERCALIGIGEKGMLEADFTLNSHGGHASSPPPHTPVGRLAKAVCEVESNPFPATLTRPVAEMYDTLGRHSSFLYRVIFANLWCFKPVLDMICKKSGGELNAMMRTTCAFTEMKGSEANNVIPPVASVSANLRLIGGESVDSAIEYLRQVVSDKDIEITARRGQNPSISSETDSDAWRKVKKAVGDTWKGALVSPYLMVQCSDSRHFCRISDKVMRFSAMELTAEERSRIHGIDERIPVEKIGKAVEFYTRLEELC